MINYEDEIAEGQRIAEAERAAYAAVVRPISISKRWRWRRSKPVCEPCGEACCIGGYSKAGVPRWQCPKCQKFIRHVASRLLSGFSTPDLKVQIIAHMLAEGISIRAAGRITRVHRDTVMRISQAIGSMCRGYLADTVTGIPASDVEVDEVWTYVFKKKHTNIDLQKKSHKVGSAWIYLGIDRRTKLILAYHIGRRTTQDAVDFMRKVRAATVGKMTVYTDGFQPYPSAVYSAFLYDNKLEDLPEFLEHPAVVVRNNGTAGFLHATDQIDYQRACTNQIERFNATLRAGVRRLTRRTHAFSKSWTGLDTSIALFLAYYNFCRPHSAIENRTPAMAAGLAESPWSIRDLIFAIQVKREVKREEVSAEIRRMVAAG